MKPLDPTGLKRLHREWRRSTNARLALVLDSVQSPFNVGAILRTAAAYRVEHVWLAGVTPSPNSSSVQKTALGTDRFLTITSVDRAIDAVDEARAEGFRIVGIRQGSVYLGRYRMSLAMRVPLEIVVGNPWAISDDNSGGADKR